jgi:pantoate--beta-alanine ligase
MKVYKTVDSLMKWRSVMPPEKSLGLVPTMGALHEGHLSLVRRARDENDLVAATIFVNPTQFDRKEDLDNYPNSLEADLAMLKEAGCDLVLVPTPEDVYNDRVESDRFDFEGLDKVMEGSFRKGHFEGVATVVRKLFSIIRPHRAYFGEKDYQQLQIIRKMVESEGMPIEIIPCEIYREPDGLAMSSRNRRLEPGKRTAATLIYQTLSESKEMLSKNHSFDDIRKMADAKFEANPDIELEYFEIADTESLQKANSYDPTRKYKAFIAAFAGPVRLIDNIDLN